LSVETEIRDLAADYAARLKQRMDDRVKEMENDDKSHFLIYQVLGVTDKEGHLIDVYQNKGRFLYKYAGTFLENAAKICFKSKFPDSGSLRVPNTRNALIHECRTVPVSADKNDLTVVSDFADNEQVEKLRFVMNRRIFAVYAESHHIDSLLAAYF